MTALLAAARARPGCGSGRGAGAGAAPHLAPAATAPLASQRRRAAPAFAAAQGSQVRWGLTIVGGGLERETEYAPSMKNGAWSAAGGAGRAPDGEGDSGPQRRRFPDHLTPPLPSLLLLPPPQPPSPPQPSGGPAPRAAALAAALLAATLSLGGGGGALLTPPPARAELATVTLDEATAAARPLPQQAVRTGRVWALIGLGAAGVFGAAVAVENNAAWFPAIAKANRAIKANKARAAAEAGLGRAAATGSGDDAVAAGIAEASRRARERARAEAEER